MGSVIQFDREREERELREYLGASFDRDRLVAYEQGLERELEAIGDEAVLYRTSEAYLYNLTAFAMTGTKLPYLDELTRVVPRGSSLLDYGCGIGSDGLALLEAGYRVAFADFDNPSTRYLRWRLERRGLDADVYDLDSDRLGGGFDLAYAFDVIEHAADPFRFLDSIEAQARIVLLNLLESEPGETALHHELPIHELLRRIATYRLLRYRVLHGRSHLVAYGTQPAKGAGRLLSRWRLLRGGRRRGSLR